MKASKTITMNGQGGSTSTGGRAILTVVEGYLVWNIEFRSRERGICGFVHLCEHEDGGQGDRW